MKTTACMKNKEQHVHNFLHQHMNNNNSPELEEVLWFITKVKVQCKTTPLQEKVLHSNPTYVINRIIAKLNVIG